MRLGTLLGLCLCLFLSSALCSELILGKEVAGWQPEQKGPELQLEQQKVEQEGTNDESASSWASRKAAPSYEELIFSRGGLNPSKLLAECDDVSSECKNIIKNHKFIPEVARAIANYSVSFFFCARSYVDKNCWNHQYNKWKQGTCDIGNHCKVQEKYDTLLKECQNAGGTLSDGSNKFGLQGSVVAYDFPICVPSECYNNDDMESLSSCVDDKTCEQLPPEVISACKVDFGGYTKDKVAIHVVFGLIFGFLGTFFISFGLAWSGKVSCKKSPDAKNGRRVLNEDRSLGGSQAGLLDGLGVNVPLTGNSTNTDDILSPPGSYIVQGTPHPLNTQCIPNVSDSFALSGGGGGGGGSGGNTVSFHDSVIGNDEENYNPTTSKEMDAVNEELTASGFGPRPKFKLSRKFERHIIRGFMFRKEELGGKKGSGWGTGSTSASSLVWRSLFYKSKGNLILKGVSGVIKPGNLVAMVGAPDSGATTLLKVLAGRTPGGKVSGEILLDGYPPTARIKKIIAFIPKEDLNLPSLTVRETLEFSLALRSPSALPENIRKERVDVVLALLGLSHVADTIVGDQLIRGISGGEKRRVCIGLELVVGRSLLLASQPTNGLDSSAAYDVIKATRALADTGLAAFMATVSQPSPELLGLFDTVCLISRGTLIYFGPTHKAEKFFNQYGFYRPLGKAASDFLEEMTGDAEQFLGDGTPTIREEEQEENGNRNGSNFDQSTSAGAGSSEGGTSPKHQSMLVRRQSIARQSLATSFRQSEEYRKLGLEMWKELDQAALIRERQEAEDEMAEIRAGLDDDGDGLKEPSFFSKFLPNWARDDDGQPYFCGPSPYTTGLVLQIWILLKRQISLTLRSPTLRVRIGRAVFQGCLIGSMFYKVGFDQQGATSRFGLLFLSINSVVFGAMSIIPELFAQRQVYYSQRSAGYFRPAAFLTALLMVEIPIVIVETMIYSLMVYGLCDLRNGIISWNYIYFWAVIATQQVTAWLTVMVVVMASPSAVVAQAAAPTIIALECLFSGYLVPKNSLIKAMRWMWDVSPLARGIKGLAINEVVGLTYYCEEDQLFPPMDDPLLNVAPPNGYYGPAYRTCPLASGSASLLMYDYNTGEQDKWKIFLTNMMFPIVLTCVLLVVMYTIHYEADSSDAAGQLMDSRKKELLEEKNRILQARKRGEDPYQYDRLDQDDDDVSNVPPPPDNLPKVSGCIEFHNLNYTVDIPSGKKQLLHNICGYAEPGNIVALMGPSGAGKSTLLDILADKKTGGYVEAEVLLINGRPRGSDYPRFSAYCEQMDSHLPTQTVREAVEASALLRLPSEAGPQGRAAMVERVLKQLKLEPFQHNMIGAPPQADGIPGVSPEVRKKTTIAVELVMDPALLYLDEPTTGLSSTGAVAVMQAVKSACQNKATICTIHQPSAEVFRLFDWILLLQTGGKVSYFGPISNMSNYFEKYGFGAIERSQNPADYALECTRKTIDGQEAADVFEASEERQAILDQAPRLKLARGEHIEGYDVESPYRSSYAAGFWTQYRQLVKTQFLFLLRDTALLKMRASTAIIFGLILGILFFDSKLDVTGAQARIAMCFIAITYVGYTTILVIPQLVDQRPVFFRETTSNAYTLVPYFLAITVAEIPFIMGQISLFLIVSYPMVGLRREPEKIFMFVFGMFVLNLACSAFSTFIAALSPNADSGTILNTVVNSVFTLFCGFLLPYKSIPVYWKWAYYMSMFRYPLSFLISSEMHGREFHCPENNRAIPIFVGGTSKDNPPFPFGSGVVKPECVFSMTNITKLLNNTNCFRYYCPVSNADKLLDQYNFPTDQGEIWISLSTLVGFYLLWRVCAFVALRNIQHIKR